MKKALLIAVFIITLVSCNKNSQNETTAAPAKAALKESAECVPVVIPALSLETAYGCNNTKYQVHINLADTFTIIKTQQDFNAQVTGSCLPNIDFVNYDLVIGKKRLLNDNKSIEYSIVKDCKTKIITMNVVFKNNIGTMAPNITYHSLIPKIQPGETLQVKTTIQ